MTSVITLSEVSKYYPTPVGEDYFALKDISLTIEPGEFVFLTGASGAGKSTLLRLLSGGVRPTGGEAVVCQLSVGQASERELGGLRRSIGLVFQDFRLLANKTVLENVSFGLESMGVTRTYRELLGLRLLQAVGLRSKAHWFPRSLSGGEQQRVALVRALAHQPKLILADEPTGSLDREMSEIVLGILQEANSLGVTVLMATHNLDLIERYNRRTLILDRGGLKADIACPKVVSW
jgi:cell division transport system ATP-binding protein